MKLKLCIFTVAASISLCACGSADEAKVIEKENTEVATEANAVADEKEDAEANVKGFTFDYNGVTIQMDADSKAYVDQLGDPVDYFEAASCAFEGIDKMYTYSGFELDTYPLDGKDFVSSVIFLDDSVATKEGVSLGATVEQVKKVYGEATNNEANYLVYEKDNMQLCFILEDNVVSSIEYRSNVLNK